MIAVAGRHRGLRRARSRPIPPPADPCAGPAWPGRCARSPPTGRAGHYQGAFGEALLVAGGGEYTEADLARSQADWVARPRASTCGATGCGPSRRTRRATSRWPAPASPSGPACRDDPDDDRWAHLTVEAARQAGYDRPSVLHEGADGPTLLDPGSSAERASRIDPDRAAAVGSLTGPGGTIYMCTVDGAGNAVSLIQSNASGFGCHVAVPGTGVLLHNRGIGFSLEPGHPAEYGPGRRPPHTLSPALVTRPGGELRAVLGTMGGDSQPQVVLQLLARLLRADEDPGTIIGAPRWVARPGRRQRLRRVGRRRPGPRPHRGPRPGRVGRGPRPAGPRRRAGPARTSPASATPTSSTSPRPAPSAPPTPGPSSAQHAGLTDLTGRCARSAPISMGGVSRPRRSSGGGAPSRR